MPRITKADRDAMEGAQMARAIQGAQAARAAQAAQAAQRPPMRPPMPAGGAPAGGAPAGGPNPQMLRAALAARAAQAAPAAGAPAAFKKGGLAKGHKTADGIAKRGKTKGIAVKMKKGGRCG